MKYKFLIICITFLGLWIPMKVDAQNHSLRIYTSYAIGQADKRYDFLYDQHKPGAAQFVKDNINKTTPDDEYSFGLGYTYHLKDKCRLNFDLGYAKLIQDFPLPANGNTYFGKVYEIFFWRNKSYYHMIQVSPGIDYTIISKDINLGLILQDVGNISFHKNIPENNLSRKKIEYFATELYPGVFAEYKGIRASLSVRALHLKNRDDAIWNNELNIDKYNPFKIKFGLSFNFLKW